jgi:hypothetical protein
MNGKAYAADPDVWVTSYWQIPERLADAANEDRGTIRRTSARTPKGPRTVLLLDSDQGKLLRGKLKSMGEETLTVAGRPQTCTHYRITGDVEVDVWYDASRRLVRQESVESGHKTLLELTGVGVDVYFNAQQ